ncbi:MAG: carbohydrate ABC transporter permease [Armatimonadota bacterium]|nr:carbohydrate ABC transporter permease [Armatimonadota bacterium]
MADKHKMQPIDWKQRKRRRIIIKQTLQHLLLMIFGISFFLPFYWLAATSLKPDAQVFQSPPAWVPHPIMWTNYPRALTYVPFAKYLVNTIVICVLTVFGVLFSSSLVAYSFSKIRWPGRNIVFFILLSTLMLPSQVTVIPVFTIFKTLHWIDTIKPLVIPAFFGSAFFIFLLRQFFMTIPLELSDAAKIDGCSELDIYWRLILPLSKPALATVALFAFIGAWNDFLGPLIYLNDETKYTLSIGLQQFVSQHGAEWSMLMAASTVMTIPIVILFFFAQKTFIQGITLTGIKQ